MKIQNLILIGTVALSSVSAFATSGNGAGNGGEVVACFTSGMDKTIAKRNKAYKDQLNAQDPIGEDGMAALAKAPELLDLYELSNTENLETGIVPLLSDPTDFRNGIVESTERVKNTNAVFNDKYINNTSATLPLAKFNFVRNGVYAVDDSNSVIKLPTGCLLLQIAIQTKIGDDFIVRIDSRLFNRMKPLDQTALFSHERILNQTVKEGDVFSDRARALNGAIYRKDFSPLFAQSMNAILQPLMKLDGKTVIECLNEVDCGYSYSKNINYNDPPTAWLSLSTHGLGPHHETAGRSGYTSRISFVNPTEFFGYFFSDLYWYRGKANDGNIDTKASSNLPQYVRDLASTIFAQFIDNDQGQSIERLIVNGLGLPFFHDSTRANHFYEIENVRFGGQGRGALAVEFSPDFKKFTVYAADLGFFAGQGDFKVELKGSGVSESNCYVAEFEWTGSVFAYKCTKKTSYSANL